MCLKLDSSIHNLSRTIHMHECFFLVYNTLIVQYILSVLNQILSELCLYMHECQLYLFFSIEFLMHKKAAGEHRTAVGPVSILEEVGISRWYAYYLECNTSDCGSGLFSIIKQYEQKSIRLWVEYGISLFSLLDIKGWIFLEYMEAFSVIENGRRVFRVQEKYLELMENFELFVLLFILFKHENIPDILFCPTVFF